MNDAWSAPDPVEGWRAWQLKVDRRRLALVPIGKGKAWPRRDAAVARCWRRRSHRAPVEACTCGLYAVRDPGSLRRARSPAVIGPVALWGTVVEHARGWRGEFAYPQRLALVCPICVGQQGVHRSSPAVVAAYADGSLIPLCDGHLRIAGLCDTRRFDVVPANVILSDLRDGYAVDGVILTDG